MTSSAPVLVGCSHGTGDPDGRRVVQRLLDDVRAAAPGVQVREAFVDVQEPRVGPVVRELVDAGRQVVVVPLLLSTGHHVVTDIGRAVEAVAPHAVSAGPLGPDRRLVDLLEARLAQVGADPQDAVVLAAAGSGDPRAVRVVHGVVAALAGRRVVRAGTGPVAEQPVAPAAGTVAGQVTDRSPGGVPGSGGGRSGPVVAGFGAAARPSVAEAVASSRAAGARRVVVASYLLAPGHFHDRVAAAGADAVTAPLAPAPELVAIVLGRYREAAERLGRNGSVDAPPATTEDPVAAPCRDGAGAVTVGGMSTGPETKDWTWVVERRCPQCGEDAHLIRPEQVPELVRQGAAQWQQVLAGAGDLHRRPRPGTWSALEYACHVRDVLRVFDGRLELMLTEDDPVFPDWDQDAAAAAGRYGDEDPAVVAGELGEAAQVIADRFASAAPQDWERPGRRGDGAGFTVTTFSRYLLHDVVHHLHDVRFPPTS